MAKRILSAVGVLSLALALAACAGKAEYHPADQSGAQPPLPKPENYLLPPMQVPKGVGSTFALQLPPGKYRVTRWALDYGRRIKVSSHARAAASSA